jgi:aspartate 1-decarboxylase
VQAVPAGKEVMHLNMLKAKIHRATVTHAELHYEGSIAIDGLLLDAAGIREYEQIHAWDIDNGQRFVTYALRAEEGSGIISVNGSAARSVQKGDLIIIAAFAQLNEAELEKFQPTCVYIAAGEGNRISHTNRSIPKQMAAA